MRPEIEEAMEIMYTFGKENCQVMDSGGKDSTVLKYIAELCRQKYGMPYSVHHNHTTIDAPETVYFVRQERDRIQAMGVPYTIHYPKETFGQLCLRKHMLPTRIARFCCEELKESYGARERVCTGVRRAESVNRSKNQGVATIMNIAKNQEKQVENNASFSKTPKGGWCY